MSRREFVQLAHIWRPENDYINGYWCSEKLDGMRAFWDGGTTIGMSVADIPWGNTAKDTKVKYSTGLWSRYGKPINCPEWWRKGFPLIPMDGELWFGRSSRQSLMSIVKRDIPDRRWEGVAFMVFDSPSWENFLMDGEIKNQHQHVVLKDAMKWMQGIDKPEGNANFSNEISFDALNTIMAQELHEVPWCEWHKQVEVPQKSDKAIQFVNNLCEALSKEGAEGLVLRRGVMSWEPKRTRNLLKVKKLMYGTGKIVGYIWGKATDKGSRHLGRMGSLTVDWEGKIFQISGFTDDERELIGDLEEGINNPGGPVKKAESLNFPIEEVVSFKYRDTTDAGVPMEARYNRDN